MFVRFTNNRRPFPAKSVGQHGFTVIELILVICAIVILVALFLPPVTRSREAARRTQCRNNLKQIGLALHNYHDAFAAFPLPITLEDGGKPTHSWRTSILRDLDQSPIYNRILLARPWNDPVNEEAFKNRIPTYMCPSDLKSFEHTLYLGIVTPRSVLRDRRSLRLRDITDGSDTTLVVMEVGSEHGVPWMTPQDADETIVTAFIGGKSKHTHTGGGHALLTDGAVRFLSENIDQQTLLGLTTADGGEKLGDF